MKGKFKRWRDKVNHLLEEAVEQNIRDLDTLCDIVVTTTSDGVRVHDITYEWSSQGYYFYWTGRRFIVTDDRLFFSVDLTIVIWGSQIVGAKLGKFHLEFVMPRTCRQLSEIRW